MDRRTVFKRTAQVDHRITALVQSHANLVVALAVVAIAVRLHTIWLLAGLLITGLLTYFAGASIGLLGTLVMSGLRFHGWAVHGFPDSSHLVLEAVGYWCNVWLAYQHRRQNAHHESSHRDQVMPWTVANEIRNSLAGIRFVLFPLYGKSTDAEILRVTDEISKIERYFEEIEQQSGQPRR